MKKLITLTAATFALAAPAFAASITLKFDNADGTSQTMTFDDSTMTATVEGAESSFAYTWDAEANKICGNPTGEGEICATFDTVNEAPTVGDTSGYTTSDGGSGTATVTALAE